MKKLYLLFLLTILSLVTYGQTSKTINVETAGTLPSLISEDEEYTIVELALTGEINGTDFRLLRRMAGRANDDIDHKTKGKMTKLDLSGVRIVAGGDWYLAEYSQFYKHKCLNDNELPESVFYGCNLTNIVLPEGLTSIGSSSLSNCSQLESIIIPNSVTVIGSRAFWGTAWQNNKPDGLLYINKLLYMYKGEMQENTSISIDEGTIRICGSAFSGCSGLTSITIPNSVTSIGSSAFSGCSGLTSVTIPNNVTTVEFNTFYGCSGLTSVSIPNSVSSIDRQAFSGCSGLTSITIPNSVTSIGYSAFSGCSGLTSITIPNSLTTIDFNIFSDCSSLNSIIVESDNPTYDSRDGCNAIIRTSDNELIYGCKNTVIPNSVTSIGSSAFLRCSGLTFITIPNSVTSIGPSAFSGCSGLTSITIPNSVTFIGEIAFSDCSSLNSIIVESDNPTFDSRDGCNAIIRTSDNELIYGCKYSVIPKSVTSIGPSAFLRCSDLTSITIPNSVTSIGSSAFSGCSDLTSITIPNSVTSIGSSAFYNCSGLSSITIPNSVTTIGSNAFYYCNNLSSVKCLAETPPQTVSTVFSNYGIPLYVPDGSIDSYKAANEWKNFTNILPISSAPEYDAVKIGDSGYGTFCSTSDLDFTDVEGLKAYTATGYDDDNGSIWLTRVYHVPAGTGLIVKGTPGTTYQVPHKSTHSYYSNMLVGNTGPTITINETDGDKTNYYLKSGKLLRVVGSATIGQYKSYLQVPTSVFARTRSLDFILDDESGTTYVPHIVQPKQGRGVYYNLQGQRVDKPTKGLYIKNGKKVVIR